MTSWEKCENAPRTVAEQVKDISALYENLFSLDFLEKIINLNKVTRISNNYRQENAVHFF